jgi:hypothetical protein
LGGLMLDFAPQVAPANATDLAVGAELLAEQTDLCVIGAKASIRAEGADERLAHNRIRLHPLPRRAPFGTQKRQLPETVRHLLNRVRQFIETVNGQLSEQFHIETNQAHSFWGLCARLYAKLTAHTLCLYLNRLMGKPECLQIKALVFPI